MVMVVVMVLALAGVSARITYFLSLEVSSGLSRRRSRATARFRRPRFTFCYSGREWSEIQPKHVPNSSHSTLISLITYIYDDFRFGNSERDGVRFAARAVFLGKS